MATQNPQEIVRQGYNIISEQYDKAFGGDDKYEAWLAKLRQQLPPRASILDVGCGTGVAVAGKLVGHGFKVVGIDISDTQIERARKLVPEAEFVRADASTLEYKADSFDAVICLYTIFHLPREAQPLLIQNMAKWLKPGGVLLAVAGDREFTGTNENWLEMGAKMWWSAADKSTYLKWMEDAGLQVLEQTFVPEGDDGHTLFWAAKPSAKT